ncbi:MAG: YraN family protein [Candidatus Buchananbacteria bacterium]|nr:YraN family protein [Candidatus Buchananbacteria bacterium]
MNKKIKIGKFGQQLAAQFLLNRDYQLIKENYYCPEGEIDLILADQKQLVFVEVKTRLSNKFGLPEEAIDQNKKEKLYQTALTYLAKEEINHDNWRIDCLAVEIDQANKKAQIRHHKNIY